MGFRLFARLTAALCALGLASCGGVFNLKLPNAGGDDTSLEALSPAATEADILVGRQAYASDGSVLTGTIPNRGPWDLTQAFPGSGYISSVINAPSASGVCSGSTILGVPGSADCSGGAGTFANYALSNMFRNNGAAQITLATEKSTLTYTGSYREVPKLGFDNDGGDGSAVVHAVRPTFPCGDTQITVSARIDHCLTQNPTTATWDGTTYGTSAEAVWKLVTLSSDGSEVWRDEHTGLLWSDRVATDSWCRASGNHQGNDPICSGTGGFCSDGSTPDQATCDANDYSYSSGNSWTPAHCDNGMDPDESTCTGNGATWVPDYCSDAMSVTQFSCENVSVDNFWTPYAAQDSSVPTSYCSEEAGLTPAKPGESWGSIYDKTKGGMGAIATSSSPKVRWRIPTRYDWLQADIDGLRAVLPNVAHLEYWSASVISQSRSYAWVFDTRLANWTSYRRDNQANVGIRCVGRSE